MGTKFVGAPKDCTYSGTLLLDREKEYLKVTLILIQYIGVEAHHCEADQGFPLKMCENNTVPQSNLAYLKNISIVHCTCKTGDFFFVKCKILNFFSAFLP